MAQVRTIKVRTKEMDGSQERMRVNVEATIVVQGGVLTKDEIDRMKRTVADRLMMLVAHEIPYLHTNLSTIKVTR
jgi:hypothetical protein